MQRCGKIQQAGFARILQSLGFSYIFLPVSGWFFGKKKMVSGFEAGFDMQTKKHFKVLADVLALDEF